jgi:hypothetical protein
MTTRWQSWHAAFEEAGKAEHSLSAPNGRLILSLTANDFAAALGDLLTTRVLLMSPEQHQEACRTGSLIWYDARGRCVVIHRESGLARARAPEDQAQWNGPSLGGLIPKGFAPPLGRPFTHPLPEPDPPPPLPPRSGPPKVELREETKPKGKKK